jgi:NADH:ubiquinone oxidoreductase subunit K
VTVDASGVTIQFSEIEELVALLDHTAIQLRRMNHRRPRATRRPTATIAGLIFVTIILAFLSLNAFFAAGTFPGDPKEQRVGLIFGGSLFLAAAASAVGVGVLIRRYRRQLKIERSSQGFPVIINELNASRSSERNKTDDISSRPT